ncbi:MAG: N-acetylmuramoyl-L-alanine amidase, partial [Campylobacter sp.]|nr:N-acetylmuramoyl-L-alanine amidase [Campylobacter sp.]
MAKIVKFLLIFLCAIYLHAGEYDEFFTKFDKTFKSANLQEQQNLHNELKNVYLRTSTSSQKEYRIDALKRLIFSSKALDYNANSYESELKRLGGEYDYPANLTLTKKENSTKNSQNVALNSPKNSSNELEKLKPQNSNSQNSQPTIVNSQNPKEIKVAKKLDPKTAKLSLNSAQVSQNELILEFNREISLKEFKNFVLQNSEHYRFVIDFDGVQNSKNKLFNGILVDEIRIAQRDLKSVRIVLSSIEKFSANLGFDKNILTIKVVQNAQKIANSEKKTDNINSQNESKKTASAPTPISRTPSSATTTSTKYNSTKGKIIVIDPGHGGKDPGALANGLKEKTIVLNTAKKLGELLKKRGYKVHYTRSNDTFINLKSRTAFANKKNADMFISIHTTAAPNKKQAPNFSGVETFFLSPARSERSK